MKLGFKSVISFLFILTFSLSALTGVSLAQEEKLPENVDPDCFENVYIDCIGDSLEDQVRLREAGGDIEILEEAIEADPREAQKEKPGRDCYEEGLEECRDDEPEETPEPTPQPEEPEQITTEENLDILEGSGCALIPGAAGSGAFAWLAGLFLGITPLIRRYLNK